MLGSLGQQPGTTGRRLRDPCEVAINPLPAVKKISILKSNMFITLMMVYLPEVLRRDAENTGSLP